MNNEQLLEIGKKVVQEIAARVIALATTQPLGGEVGSTGVSGHKTKLADEFSEGLAKDLIAEFSRECPDQRVILISEETGLVEYGNLSANDGYIFVLDPLDGSNNLRAWRTPAASVSISLGIGKIGEGGDLDSVKVAVVGDIFNQRLYYATKGGGAYVEGFGAIHASPEERLDHAVLGIDLDVREEAFDQLSDTLHPILKNKKCQRRLGSSILDFCKVASGEYDAFLSTARRLGYYDIAAVKLIVEEAGGIFEITAQPEYSVFERLLKEKNTQVLEEAKYSIVAAGTGELLDELLVSI